MTHPLETRPQSVCFLAGGASIVAYAPMMIDKLAQFDEVWAIKSAGLVFRHDKCFAMDDIETQMTREFKDNLLNILAKCNNVITSTPQQEKYPNTYEFPIEDVYENVKTDLLTSSLAHAVAYAMTIDVKGMAFYGCDFGFKNKEMVGEGMQSVCWLLGKAEERGTIIKISPYSTLLYENKKQGLKNDPLGRSFGRPIYGYLDSFTNREYEHEMASDVEKKEEEKENV